jgi:hypothetical protein
MEHDPTDNFAFAGNAESAEDGFCAVQVQSLDALQIARRC